MRRKNLLFAFILSIPSVYAFSLFKPIDRSIFWSALYGMMVFIFFHLLKIDVPEKTNFYSVILGFFLSGFMVVGYELKREGTLAIYFSFIIQFLGIAIFFFLLLRAFFSFVSLSNAYTHIPVKFSTKETLLTALIIFFCWLPWLIIFYPGTMSSDALGEIRQLEGLSPLSNHHPIIHQLMIKLCLLIAHGSVELGTVFYAILQMAFLSISFSLVISYLRDKAVPNTIIVIVFVFYAIFPVNPLYAIMMEKGSVFAGFTVLLMLCLLREAEEEKEHSASSVLFFVIISFFFCTTRNNGLYAFIIGMFFFILINRCKWRYLLKCTLISLTVVFLYQFIIFNICDIQKSSTAEMLSVPIQQIARVIKKDSSVLEAEEISGLKGIFPEIEKLGDLYEPTISDPVKQPSVFDSSEFDKNTTNYIKYWLKLGINHPKEYLEAFLMQNYGYWFPDTDYHTVSYSIYTPNDFGLCNNSKFEPLRATVMRFTDWLQYKSLIAPLFSIGFSFWLILISAVALYLTGRGREASPLSIIFALWFTTLASPVYCEYRYLYGLVVCIPLFMPLLFGASSAYSQ